MGNPHDARGTLASAAADMLCSLIFLRLQASSDHNAYLYDIRASSVPLTVLKGHSKAVSYVRFFGADRLATASTDGTLACWGVPDAVLCAAQRAPDGEQGSSDSGDDGLCAADFVASSVQPVPACKPSAAGRGAAAAAVSRPWRTFAGHRNRRLFTGLAVRPEDGLMACGSESHHVHAYHVSWSQPLASHHIRAAAAQGAPRQCGGSGDQPRSTTAVGHAGSPLVEQPPTTGGRFVSAVAFQPHCAADAQGGHGMLAAASSNGDVCLLALAAGAAA